MTLLKPLLNTIIVKIRGKLLCIKWLLFKLLHFLLHSLKLQQFFTYPDFFGQDMFVVFFVRLSLLSWRLYFFFGIDQTYDVWSLWYSALQFIYIKISIGTFLFIYRYESHANEDIMNKVISYGCFFLQSGGVCHLESPEKRKYVSTISIFLSPPNTLSPF